MSKPTTRIVFAVLISLIIVAGIYTSVLGAAALQTGVSGKARADASLAIQPRIQVFQSQGAFGEVSNKGGHRCDSEAAASPED